jgi:hypothetical protein
MSFSEKFWIKVEGFQAKVQFCTESNRGLLSERVGKINPMYD